MSQIIEFFGLFYCLIGSVMVSIICHKFEFIYFARAFGLHISSNLGLFMLLMFRLYVGVFNYLQVVFLYAFIALWVL